MKRLATLCHPFAKQCLAIRLCGSSASVDAPPSLSPQQNAPVGVNVTSQLPNDVHRDSIIPPAHVRLISDPHEAEAIEIQRLQHLLSQEGPFIGSREHDSGVDDATRKRARREIVRVKATEPEYLPNETSFRRLPRDLLLPSEHELRAAYPQSTSLALINGEADCVDLNALSVDEPALPMEYTMLAPVDWRKEECYPYLVVLSDERGTEHDFQDVCANFFERPLHRELMEEQKWVVISPVINIRHSFHHQVEGIVARFCDWVTSTFNVEHGRVHLFGKGLGAYAALRTCLEHRQVALSVTAILGRNGSPFRPMDRTQEKMKNYVGVHTLVYVPGLLGKQDYFYKFKFMMDMARIRPAMRNIHFADVRDHQVYYAINPYEFWNHMRYFRQYHPQMLTESSPTAHQERSAPR